MIQCQGRHGRNKAVKRVARGHLLGLGLGLGLSCIKTRSMPTTEHTRGIPLFIYLIILYTCLLENLVHRITLLQFVEFLIYEETDGLTL